MFVLAPKDGEVFSPETLNAIARLTEQSWQIPYSLRVDSITNYQHTEARDDDLLVDDLVPEEVLDALDEVTIQRIRNIALNEPLLVDHLISASGHVTGVNVTIQLPDDTSGEEVPSIAAFSRELAEKARTENPHLDIYVTGMVMMNNSFPEVSIHDQQTLVPLMFGIIILTLILLLRSFVATVGTFMIIIFSIATAGNTVSAMIPRLTMQSHSVSRG